MTAGEWLHGATRTLRAAGIASARLDGLILLEDATGRERSWLLAHPEDKLTASQKRTLSAQLAARAARTPLAYIRGKTAFYGRDFAVDQRVLIPRPETEPLVAMLLDLPGKTVLDVGTGSGAIAISAALERFDWRVAACDISLGALKIAAQNAAILGARVDFFESDLLTSAKNYTIIAANLPYVDKHWPVSPEVAHEPRAALFAADNGLALIKKLISQAPAHLNAGGHLLLEADPRQHAAITTFAAPLFNTLASHGFTLLLKNK